MTCPHCKNYQFDGEELLKDQDDKRAVACPKCHKPAIIWWRVEHFCETIEDAFSFSDVPVLIVKEIAQAVEESY